MSRSTQFIGLNKCAQRFIMECAIDNENNRKTWSEVEGMFDEPYPLTSWICKLHSDAAAEDKTYLVREVVQAEPSSSGPMIFTCLEVVFDEQAGGNGTYRICEWRNNPLVKGEVDYECGEFWV